jgi:secreted PhoX family phosphatase
MTEVRDIPLGDYLNQVLAVSPNGKTFVSWESQPFSENTSIVVWSVDELASLGRAATIPLDGQVTGAAFDPTGEKLYVTMQNPGRIVVLE